MKAGMAPLVVTQFGFDAFLVWLKELPRGGIMCPVRIGIQGLPIKRLLARGAPGASASVMKKYMSASPICWAQRALINW
jgi:hypothetical protein